MIVCIDTCVLLQAGKAGHPFQVIFDAWFQRRLKWAVSNEVLTEYQEIIVLHSGVHRWNQLCKVLSLAETVGDLLIKVHPTYRFQAGGKCLSPPPPHPMPELVGRLNCILVHLVMGRDERNSCLFVVPSFEPAPWALTICEFKCHLKTWVLSLLIQVPKNLLARNGRLGIG